MILRSEYIDPNTVDTPLPFLDVKLVGVTLSAAGDYWAHFECDKFDGGCVSYEFAIVEDDAKRPIESDGWRYIATFERSGFEHIYARTAR
jgi:hypothetical protein